MFLLLLVYCIWMENSPGGKIKNRDSKGREQNAEFVILWRCLTEIASFMKSSPVCFQAILILAGKSVL